MLDQEQKRGKLECTMRIQTYLPQAPNSEKSQIKNLLNGSRERQPLLPTNDRATANRHIKKKNLTNKNAPIY